MNQGDTLAQDIDLLLGDLCAGWGFCNYTVFGSDLLRDGGGVVTDAAIARAVLDAEGYDDLKQFRAIKRFFQYRYGAGSVAEADYTPGVRVPYSGFPPSDGAAEEETEPPDPILFSARELVRLLTAEEQGTVTAQPEGLKAWFPSPFDMLDPGDVVRSIRKARWKRAFTLGPEEEKARQDVSALILLHERITGRFWNSDPQARRRLGLGSYAGTLADTSAGPT